MPRVPALVRCFGCSCLLAVTCKEVTAVAPLFVLWYDRALLASTWREIIRRRWAYYAGLACAWPILAALMLSRAHKFARRASGGEVHTVAIRCEPAESHRPLLAALFLADGAVLGLQRPVARTAAEIIPAMLSSQPCLLRPSGALLRGRRGVSGGVVLPDSAPTSSVFPIRDIAFEHRMYLPLAAVVAAWSWARSLSASALSAAEASRGQCRGSSVAIFALSACIALGILTYQRNRDYRTALSIWQDAVDKSPMTNRGHTNLGLALARAGRFDDAIIHYREGDRNRARSGRVALQPGVGPGKVRPIGQGHRQLPTGPKAQAGLCRCPQRPGHRSVAAPAARRGRHPFAPGSGTQSRRWRDSITTWRAALEQSGKLDEAIIHFRKAVEIEPDFAEARKNLADALGRRQKTQ